MARSPQRRDEQSGFDFQFLSLSNAIAIQVTRMFLCSVLLAYASPKTNND